jgi:hypothetical protein
LTKVPRCGLNCGQEGSETLHMLRSNPCQFARERVVLLRAFELNATALPVSPRPNSTPEVEPNLTLALAPQPAHANIQTGPSRDRRKPWHRPEVNNPQPPTLVVQPPPRTPLDKPERTQHTASRVEESLPITATTAHAPIKPSGQSAVPEHGGSCRGSTKVRPAGSRSGLFLEYRGGSRHSVFLEADGHEMG